MANDELQRDPSQLIADFIEHTRDACWDLQFYVEWCINHDLAPDPMIAAYANLTGAFREIAREGLDDRRQLIINASGDECGGIGFRLADYAINFHDAVWEAYQPPDPRASR